MVANIIHPITVLCGAEELQIPPTLNRVSIIRSRCKAVAGIAPDAIARIGGRFVPEHAIVDPGQTVEFVKLWGQKGGASRKRHSSIDFQRIVPQEAIGPLAKLGQHRWLIPRPVPKTKKTEFTVNVPTGLLMKHEPEVLSRLMQLFGGDIAFVAVYCYSRLFAYGPKLLQPTVEQCIAFEHTELRIPFESYHQPFPTVVIELPNEYRKILSNRFQRPSFPGLVLDHDEMTGYILASEIRPMERGVTAVMAPRKETPTLERALLGKFSDGPEDAEIELVRAIERVGMNLCVLLTMNGAVNRGPVDPSGFERLKRLKKGKNALKAKRAKLLMQTMPRLIELEQNVTVFREQSEATPSRTGREGSHSLKSPHWRRGHFRQQRVGPGRTDTKLVFIKPVLINKEFFVGDLKDTRATYSSSRPNDKNQLRLPKPEAEDN